MHPPECPTTPPVQRTRAFTYGWFGLFPFRSPLLRESQPGLRRVMLLSFPRGTEMVHFSRLPLVSYFIQIRVTGYESVRLPDSGIFGSKLANSSPKLIAVNHALHRLLAPRHSPQALSSLITGVGRLFLWLPLLRYAVVKEQNLKLCLRQKLFLI